MKRVLILCTGNSCRSQMAEALWRARWGDEWECLSAGTEPAGEVHPLAIAVLEEVGLSTARLHSKALSSIEGQAFDLVVTVCDNARESCPVLLFPHVLLHWPFPDPAAAEGDEVERRAVFREVRDRIDAGIAGFVIDPALAERFRTWMEGCLELYPGGVATERAGEHRRIVEGVARLLERAREPWQELPGVIAEVLGERGWAWNGIYALRGEDRASAPLALAAGAGPPVCGTIERRGGAGTSGLCFDALLMNQTVAVGDVGRWPGYVSCDDESGLATVAGLASPIRNPSGTPIGVWDLDSTRPLEPLDATFIDRLIATLSALLRPVQL
ncbi:MAG: hypothetical protein ACE5GW_06595 [Planctomycetota bacterium]